MPKNPAQWLVSASQVQLWLSCQRKWAAQYLEERPQPPSTGQETGTRYHQTYEDYAAKRPLQTSDLTRRLAQALRHYPSLEEPHEIEAPFELEGWRGKIDILRPDAPHVIDHKTSANPERYALTSKGLANSIQQVVYAAVAATKFNLVSVHSRWVYVATRGAVRSHAVDVTTEVSDVRRKFEALHSHRDAIREAVKNRLPMLAHRASPISCHEYGGCPYHVRKGGPCSPEKEVENMGKSLLDLVKNKQKHEAESPPVEVLRAGVAKEPVQTTPVQTSLFDRLQQTRAEETTPLPEKHSVVLPLEADVHRDADIEAFLRVCELIARLAR